MLAYYPLGHGKLAGGKMRSTQSYREISSKHGNKTTPAQVALTWLSSRSNVVFPIPRGSNTKHVEEDLGAVGWRLDGLDMDLLSKDFPA
jgi:diketogulonate reductase-like aldo/keto reductase